jgi:hypothetical protein
MNWGELSYFIMSAPILYFLLYLLRHYVIEKVDK